MRFSLASTTWMESSARRSESNCRLYRSILPVNSRPACPRPPIRARCSKIWASFELGALRRQTPALVATGLTHLFTGRQLDGDTAGIAYSLGLCSQRFAVSLTMAHNSAALDTLITAHEIGHVFGAPHDGTEECASTPQNQYIMTPTLSTAVTSFSQCSLDQINAVIDSYSCVVPLPAPGPAPPAPPAPPPEDDGGGGGGGSLDPFLLLFLLALRAARPRLRARSPASRRH